jgi:hypothetical protein
MSMKIKLISAALLVACATGCKPKYVCQPQGDDKCPDAADYAFVKSYLDKYKPPTPPREESDRATGAWQRMQIQCGPGYNLDPQKVVCVKRPQPTPVQTPAQPSTQPK